MPDISTGHQQSSSSVLRVRGSWPTNGGPTLKPCAQ